MSVYEERLFDIEGVPEVPLFREPRRRKGAARGVAIDARFENDYPLDWEECGGCGGDGEVTIVRYFVVDDAEVAYGSRVYRDGVEVPVRVGEAWTSWTPPGDAIRQELDHRPCPRCRGMGRLKGRVRLEAGHRCVRCLHPFITKGDAPFLSRLRGETVLPTPGHWSPCDGDCEHEGPLRVIESDGSIGDLGHETANAGSLVAYFDEDWSVEAEWRVLTVHHLDGDKANCRWWNLAALCQRCHLEIQAKVVMERVYIHEHSEWFKPYAAGYYAHVYLGEDLERPEVMARLDELLDLERATA